MRSRRCRLVQAAIPDQVADPLAKVELDPSDSFANARRVKQQLGWDIVKGFAIFEFAGTPHKFVAHQRWWNNTPFESWVDVTREKPAAACEGGVVYAESDLAANHAPSAETLAAEKRADEIRQAAIAATARSKVRARCRRVHRGIG